MRILKLICLYICLAGILDAFAMEQPPKKPRTEDIEKGQPAKKQRTEERAAPSQITLANLPKELHTYILQFINAPTLEDAIQKIKAYLLTSKKTAAYLRDESFTRSLLLELQKRFHRSMLEIANLMKSVASKKIAEDLKQEAEKSWKEYLDAKAREGYAKFIFETRKDVDIIPSLLYYNYSRPNQIDIVMVDFAGHYGGLTVQNLKFLIESGLLNHGYNLHNLWLLIVTLPDDQKYVDLAKLLIDAGYNVNIIVNGSHLRYYHQNVDRLPPTLLDFVISKINDYTDRLGTRSHSMIANLNKILRMLIKAGAKSSYELQNP